MNPRSLKPFSFLIFIALALSLALSQASAYDYGSNLILNPDVETGIASPDNWNTSGGSWNTTESRSPTHSLLLNPAVSDQNWRCDYYSVEPNKNYNVSAYVKGTVTSGEFFLTVRWFSNADGTGFISENNTILSTYADWTFIATALIAPSNALSSDVLFRAVAANGTLYGDDFALRERMTGFASTPITSIHPLETYNYTVVAYASWGNLSMTTTADWLVIDDLTSIVGIPTADDIGSYRVNLTLTNDTQTQYQNYTILVLPSTGNVTTWALVTVAISFVFGFGFLAFGIVARDFFLKFVSGIVWVFSGVFIYGDFSVGWLAISICVGLYIMLLAGFDYQKGRGGI